MTDDTDTILIDSDVICVMIFYPFYKPILYSVQPPQKIDNLEKISRLSILYYLYCLCLPISMRPLEPISLLYTSTILAPGTNRSFRVGVAALATILDTR